MFMTFIMNQSTGTHAEQNAHLSSINEDYEQFCEIWEYEDEYIEDLLSSDLVATQHDSQASQAKAASLAGVPKMPSSVFNRTKEADYCAFESWPSVPKWRTLKFTSKKTVVACSGWRPKQAFIWISKAEKAKSWEELEDDEGSTPLAPR